MPLTEKDFDLIDKYLLGQLTDVETTAFEQRTDDPDFQKEWQNQADVLPVLKKAGRDSLKSHFQTIEKNRTTPFVQTKKNNSNKLSVSFRRLLSVAAFLSSIALGIWWWQTKALDTNEVFAQYYEPFPNVVAPLTKSESTSTTYEQAFQNYEQQNYAQAEQLLSTISDESGQFYLGLTYLAEDKSITAIPLLEKINEEPSARFFAASQWYLALAYLKTNQLNKTISQLELIIENGQHPFRQKAMDLKNLITN